MKYYFLFFFSIGLLYLGCAVRQAPKPAATPPKVYPEEQNFLRSMNIGDTVFIFIKESGYFQPTNNPYFKTHLTCYSKHVVCRTNSFAYKHKLYYALPGGQQGLDFEFDTLKFQLDKTLKLFSSLELWCNGKEERDLSYMEDNCWIEEFYKDSSDLSWLSFSRLGLSDSIYNEWRFNFPTHDQLKTWREAMLMNQPRPIWKYEVLSFYKDTCKISYSDRIAHPFPYDFSKLE